MLSSISLWSSNCAILITSIWSSLPTAPHHIQCCWLLLSRFSRVQLCVASVVSNSCPTLQLSPPGSPVPGILQGKNTGVGCHFLLQCMKERSESEVAHWCPILSDPMDCSLPGSSVHGIFQARVLEWGAIAFSNHTHYHHQNTHIQANKQKKHNSPFFDKFFRFH